LSPTAATTATPFSTSSVRPEHGPTFRAFDAGFVHRSVDHAIYRQRNLIERFFSKHFRRFATRFNKLARNYLAAPLLASTRLWLRAYESTTYANPPKRAAESIADLPPNSSFKGISCCLGNPSPIQIARISLVDRNEAPMQQRDTSGPLARVTAASSGCTAFAERRLESGRRVAI